MARLSLWPLLLASLVLIPIASAGEESGEFDRPWKLGTEMFADVVGG